MPRNEIQAFLADVERAKTARRVSQIGKAMAVHFDGERTRLMKRIAELERALEPFANEADQWSDKVDGRYQPSLTEPRQRFAYAKAVFSLNDLRRARRLVRGKVTRD